MRLLYIGALVLVTVGCSPQNIRPEKSTPTRSCAWHIANEDSAAIPSICDGVAFQFARMYVNEHLEIAKGWDFQ